MGDFMIALHRVIRSNTLGTLARTRLAIWC
jgi:hypothetical protein